MNKSAFLFLMAHVNYLVGIYAEECSTPDDQVGKCVHLLECPIVFAALTNPKQNSSSFLDKHFCKIGKRDMVCCKPENLNKEYVQPDPFNVANQVYCGFQHSDDYFHPINEVSIYEFPWIAVIVLHVFDNNGFHSFPICSGTLIHQQYVLTSTDCLLKHKNDRISVRLGKFSIDKKKADCFENRIYNVTECSESEEYEVEKRILHPYRVGFTYNNDIALLRLKNRVLYSDVIRPICLPLPKLNFPNINESLYVSGWNDQFFVKGTTTKRKILTSLITNEQCGGVLRTTMTDYNLCTIGNKNNSDPQCYLDKGGPLVLSFKNQWYIVGILSEFSGKCDNFKPLIFMRVSRYMEWIYENTRE